MDYDSWLEEERISNDPMEKKVLFTCDACGGEIYDGNEYFNADGNTLCEDCFDEYLEEYKNECRKIAGDDD